MLKLGKKKKLTKGNPKKKGQSTLEFLVLATAVVVVFIWFLRPGGPFSNAYNDTLIEATNGMTNMAWRLSGSRPFGN